MSNFRKFESNYDLSGLEVPAAINKIDVFERKNDVSVTVLALKGPEVYIARKSECKSSKDVKLLLLTNGECKHNMTIKSLSRMLRSRNTKRKSEKHFCLNCLQGFHSELSRDKHYKYCKDNKSVKIEMPKPGSFMESHDGQNQFKVPFTMYADFEAMLGPVHGPSPSPNEPYTKVSQLYILKQYRFWTGCTCTYSHVKYPKACTTGQIDASHWESLLCNESYQHILEEANELAKMLLSTAID